MPSLEENRMMVEFLGVKNMKTKEQVQKLLSGVWHNQHNSQMHIEVDESGKIAGCFLSGVISQEDTATYYPLTGFALGDVFAFSVAFSNHGTITTWIGQVVDEEGASFEASWQMVVDANQDKEKSWKSKWSGQDRFVRGPRELETCPSPKDASHPLYCSII